MRFVIHNVLTYVTRNIVYATESFIIHLCRLGCKNVIIIILCILIYFNCVNDCSHVYRTTNKFQTIHSHNKSLRTIEQLHVFDVRKTTETPFIIFRKTAWQESIVISTLI